MAATTVYFIPEYKLMVRLSDNQKATITSELNEYLCDSFTQTEQEYSIAKGQVVTLESLILNLACEGIDIGSKTFIKGLSNCLKALQRKPKMSSNAWETTSEDVSNVLHSMNKRITEKQTEKILNNLDQFAIENSALQANDLETQTTYAYEEIKRQITEENLI
jgi:hypothetical protein